MDLRGMLRDGRLEKTLAQKERRVGRGMHDHLRESCALDGDAHNGVVAQHAFAEPAASDGLRRAQLDVALDRAVAEHVLRGMVERLEHLCIGGVDAAFNVESEIGLAAQEYAHRGRGGPVSGGGVARRRRCGGRGGYGPPPCTDGPGEGLVGGEGEVLKDGGRQIDCDGDSCDGGWGWRRLKGRGLSRLGWGWRRGGWHQGGWRRWWRRQTHGWWRVR